MGQLLSHKQLVSEQDTPGGKSRPIGEAPRLRHMHSALPRAGVACVAVVLCWTAKAVFNVGLHPLFSVALL